MKSKRMVRLISLVLSLGMMLTCLPVAGATATDFTSQIQTKAETGATYRLGVISDSHLDPVIADTKLPVVNMKLALETMQALGVDALAMNGDMVYAQKDVPSNLYDKLKELINDNGTFTLAGTMNNDDITFEADTTGDKKPIIYSMGNHEFPLSATSEALVKAAKERFTEQTDRAPRHVMKLGGYTFIVGEPADYLLDYTGANENFVREQIEAAIEEDPTKPIFYLQHEAVHGTVIESPTYVSDKESDNTMAFKEFLQTQPNVIVLSGHSHAIIEDPRSIWQDGFTAIATSQVGGGSVSGGSQKYSIGEENTGSQAIMIDLTEVANATEVAVYRLNLLTGKVIGTPIEFTIDGTKNETFKFTNDRYNAGVSVANFSEDAHLEITNSSRQTYKFNFFTTQASVTPGADVEWLQDDYLHTYRVVLKNKDKGVIEQNFKAFGDIYAEESKRVARYNVKLPNALNLATNYELSVYALTPFTSNLSVSELESKGIRPVTDTFTTDADLTDAEKASIAANGGINVALHQTVYTSVANSTNKGNLVNGSKSDKVMPPENNNYEADSVVSLPSGETVAGSSKYEEDWYMIDLGRRYNLAQVKVWPSTTASDGYMQNFAVQASNTEDFSSYVTLGSFTSDVNNTTPRVFAGDSNAYRYVRLIKTANSYYTLSELEVFAAVKSAEDLIGPKVMNATRVDDTTIGVSFAHKMDEATVEAAGALVVKNGDATITPSSVTLSGADEWDGGYDATLTFASALPANGLTLIVDGSVGTIDGSTFIDDLNVPIAGKALSINKSYSKTREDVNVALNKTVYAGNNACLNFEGYAASNLVDGSTSNLVLPPDSRSSEQVTLPSGAKVDASMSSVNDWYMIDLGRRYAVSSVVVHPRATNHDPVYMQGFAIEASNDETFTTYVPLGGVKADDTSVDGTTAVTVQGDGGAYRYIRLKKTAGTYHIYSEIEVFADMTITDVARGKSTEWGDYYSTCTGAKAVDGNTNTEWRLNGNASQITNLVVDLSAEYPIEVAQLYRGTLKAYDEYTDFKAYGYSGSADKPATTGGPSNSGVMLFNSYPGFSKTASSKYYDITKGNYRYLVLSKDQGKGLSISEFKAFVVNPEAYSAVAKDGKLTVSFTDKMEISTLVASNFAIDGVTLSNPQVTSGWDGGYDVTFDYSGTIENGDALTIDGKVRNESGIEMAANQTLSVVKNTFIIEQNSVEVAKPVAGTACNITASFVADADATAIMFVAIKGADDRLVSCKMSEETAITEGEAATLTVNGVTLKSGEKLCLFVWEKGTLRPIVTNLTVQSN